MYRFSLIIFGLALAGFFLHPQRSGVPAQDDPRLVKTATDHLAIVSGTVVYNGNRADRLEAEHKSLAALDRLSMIAAGLPPQQAVEAGGGGQGDDRQATLDPDPASETEVAAHLPSSVRADEPDPALAVLSLFDLKASAQRHLKRLGCYAAKIDGLWGPKSRAAVDEFNKVTGGAFDETPSPRLVGALQGAPDGICQRRCQSGAENGSCGVASASKGTEGLAVKQKAPAYLPPWMRGAKLVSADPSELIAASDAAPTAIEIVRKKPSLTARSKPKREAASGHGTKRHERGGDWGLEAWPATAR